ncbi:uncharacterized protein LOC124672813 [Lolium rigidum]|uniref:uncharacterized protein LOC124672813 n=1 Tax=Lolium rigidum TaxID=89674 RepID=UPI001F5CC148|nr:uncharacterized protein LOC124672813 [Lolium rigidum]
MCGKACKVGGAASPAGTSSTATSIVVLASLLLVASAVVFLLSPPPPPADARGLPEPVELAIGVAGHEGWLDALRAWAKLACLRLRPLEPRYRITQSPVSMKKAARQGLEMGKEAVEHTAESAARAAEETIGRTSEKVRRKVSSSRRSDEEL